ncbi:MAG TPA: hybrid sensor histidine kinase/response regulator [Chitinophaga sp.]|uniref:ATP-binding response regulator n=1 Tax=Chitinophaga sp. TaxID=1869181 RepID=UPI002CA96048|nr:hybrid sensor histidine kinase/response regulator [Chitinophaga sp.]HVI44857.1 hybrid sensor histidine kinase/response regulator [Chitinophaga sp.]
MNPQNSPTVALNAIVNPIKKLVWRIFLKVEHSTIFRVVTRFLSMGVSPGMDIETKSNIVIVNTLSWSTAFIAAIGPAMIYFFIQQELLVLLPGLFESLLCLTVVYLNYIGRHMLAAKGFYVLQCIAILYFGTAFDRSAGVQQMAFFMGGLSLLLFKSTGARLFCFGLILATLYALEYNYNHNVFNVLRDKMTIISVRQVVYPVILILNFLVVLLYEFSKDLRRKETERSNKILSMYGAKLSHDSRNALHRLSNLIELNRAENGMAAHVPNYMLDIMQENVKELLLLNNNLLSYGKLNSGAAEKIYYQPVPLKSTLVNAADAFTVYGNKKNVRVKLELEDDVPAGIITDQDKLIRIVNNLLSNALKFSPIRTIITLKAKRGLGNVLHIYITDQGRGIPAQQHESIFEPFVSEDSKEGNGIGLTTARYFARLLGGDLTVHESYINHGTTFLLSIPIKEAVLSSVVKENVKMDFSNFLLLVVDDDEINLNIATLQVKDTNMKVITTENPLKAIHLIEHCNPDVILLDLVMPEMNGEQLLSHIRKNRMTRHIPVIITSGRSEITAVDGAVAVLHKPYNVDELLHVLTKIQEHKSA